MQNHIYDLCKQHMHQHVLLQTTLGEQIAGVITNLDDENVYLTVPGRSDNIYDDSRQGNPYGGGPQYPPRPRPPHGPGYPPGPGPRPPYGGYPPYYPGYPGYPYPPYGPAPHPGPRPGPNQLIIPLAALTAISLIPFI
ncbi:MAG TPA: hypothetical protein GXZ58_00255 [Bacilli bacterium]|nr:hypothetical protein [Bacilli bacterium]